MITPIFAINNLQDYLISIEFSISESSQKIFYDYENLCFHYNMDPFFRYLLIAILKNNSRIREIVNRYGGNAEKALAFLINDISNKDIIFKYQDNLELYSDQVSLNNTRRMVIDECISIAESNNRRKINDIDILLTLLNLHESDSPIIEHSLLTDSKLHTPFITLSHIPMIYSEYLWVKFEDIRYSLNTTYDLAISFAGEDRETAKFIADEISKLGYKVFYDDYYNDELWGKDLYEHLNDIYCNRAKYCLMIISKYYAQKRWTTHERKAAQARAFKENKEYILPLKIDDTVLPGVLETVGYIDLRKVPKEEIVILVSKKLSI